MIDSIAWLLIADNWLGSALAWAKRGNKFQTQAAIREYDKALVEAFK